MNGFSDDILVAAAQRGDKSAYAILVKRYYGNVFALCVGVLGNVHDAEDIAQDAMLAGFLKIKRLRSNKKFGPWVLQIAKNRCFDFLRRSRRMKLFAVVKEKSPEKTNDNYDLEQAVRELPYELRLPLVMYYFNNENINAIAETFHISDSAVWQRIRAARKQLHKHLTREVQNE